MGIVTRYSWDEFERELADTPLPPTPKYLPWAGARFASWESYLSAFPGSPMVEVITRSLRKTAMPTSWRSFADEMAWLSYDACITSEGGGNGRRAYEVYVFGQQVASRPSLHEAKAVIESKYGPCAWNVKRMPPVPVVHKSLGLTTEFTSPTQCWVAELPTRTAKLTPVMYHLTDKVDFKLDPKRHPANNTTLGGDWPHAGIFLSDRPESWLQGYGYWQPWLVEFEVDQSVAEVENFMGQGYGGEVFIPATAYDKLRIKRVLPIDGYCREEYQEWGWTESYFETDFETGKPLPEGPPRFMSSTSVAEFRDVHPGRYTAFDARTKDKMWQNDYKKRVTKYRRAIR
jgi:hypothetical protein